MQKAGEAKVTEAHGDDYTKVTFSPDLAKFHMEELDDDIVGLMCRRAYDVAGTSPGVKVFLNGKRLPVRAITLLPPSPCVPISFQITGFKAYVEQYLKDKTDDNGEPLKFAYEQINDRWEVAVTVSDKNLQQVSFVNSIATTKVLFISRIHMN
jgi:DNA topoisomerase-2